ncbi:MAG: HNH endonuclease [Nitrospirales bacterium]
MPSQDSFYELDSDPALQRHIKVERERARKLRKTQWWLSLINKETCHYCQQTVSSSELTMDHIVPLARKGKSTKGNVVPSCRACNAQKQLGTPVEATLDRLRKQEH